MVAMFLAYRAAERMSWLRCFKVSTLKSLTDGWNAVPNKQWPPTNETLGSKLVKRCCRVRLQREIQKHVRAAFSDGVLLLHAPMSLVILSMEDVVWSGAGNAK